MALGLSGSGGNYNFPFKKIELNKITNDFYKDKKITYIDYFINDSCNLKCKHCYINYKKSNLNEISIEEYKDSFDQLIGLGGKVFGMVGKEPLITWEKTFSLLKYFDKKKKKKNIKYGMVTNATLLDKKIINNLKKIDINYLDISFDGDEKTHDFIRGKGNYQKILKNINRIKDKKLMQKIFIIFTLNNKNKDTFKNMVLDLYKIGIKNFIVSPYLSIKKKDKLLISKTEYCNFIKNLLDNKIIDLNILKDLNIQVRTDYQSKEYVKKLISEKIIDTTNILKDKTNALFYIKKINTNKIYFNIQLQNPDYYYSLRISHDGFVSNCKDMFYKDYNKRAIGNVREKNITEIIKDYKLN
jgi:sulfatase maturation enzyme AslB (radical SAM superfamily)